MNRVMLFDGPRSVSFRDEEDAVPQAGQVRIKTLYSGISSGTEMNGYRGIAPFFQKRFDQATRLFLPGERRDWEYPITSGYENVGEVTEVGPDVQGLQVGDIVFTYAPHQSRVVTDYRQAYKLPAGVAPEHGLSIALLGVSYNAILDARILLGETLVVFGMGVIGQLVAQLGRLSGASQVIAVDKMDSRLARARRVDPDLIAINPDGVGDVALRVRELSEGRGADVAIECSGSSFALAEAIRTVCFNGLVVEVSYMAGEARGLFLGEEFHHNRVRIHCSQASGVNPELYPRWDSERKLRAAIAVLPRLDLEGLISHRFPFARAAEAYELVDQRPQECIQVILTYDE